MRFLLDECIDPNMVKILEGLGHDATHVSLTEHRSQGDPYLVEVAKDYDVFVTLDLFRQEREMMAAYRALIDGHVKILRIRLPKAIPGQKHDKSRILLDTLRSMTSHMERWLDDFASGKCFVTISRMGENIRSRTSDEVRAMLMAQAPEPTSSSGED